MSHKRHIITAAAASLLLPAATQAEELEIGLGLGISAGQSIYRGVDTQYQAIPLLNLQYGAFYLEGFEAGYQIADNDRFNLYAALAADSLDGERTDGDLLDDLGDADSGVNLKLGGEFYTPAGILGGYIAQDVSDEHEGTELNLSWAVPTKLAGVQLKPAVYATWMSDELTNHYYGVSAANSRPGRAAYTADSGWRYGVEVMAQYPPV
ncbi:MipA/OmpV family protein [Marinobacterium jannaschii]|uniref:MipA/OmpV family protein n=1 Tax=Marinobacterium jannaschii TaxID=64970 RepID=UPI00047F1317